jgi:nucleoside-diphosphate-sugar epimerase
MIESLKNKKVLVTGGAGFIGSNLVEALLNLGAVVTVFDNLETGKLANLTEFESNPNFTFIQGDLRNVEDCQNAVKGIDVISHQAALGSVPRSIEFPHNTHAVNATGFLNMLHAAKEEGIKRFVYASSSSVYGDSTISPKVIGSEGNLLSPYAVTKQLNEKYANVYALLHQMETIGLRYFNVFGPKQDPHGVYAAAIPKFIDKLISNESITINGDGKQTRDFTYVKNAVRANLLALSTNNEKSFGAAFNVACGDSFTLIEVIESLQKGLLQKGINSSSEIIFGPERPGDVRHSLANIDHIVTELNYAPLYTFQEGIDEYIQTLSLK